MTKEPNIDDAGYDLSPQQARVSRNLALLAEDSEPGHNVYCCWRIDGTIDVQTLDQALATIADHWEIVRTGYVRLEGFKEAVQVIRDEADLSASVTELSESGNELKELFRARALKPFNQRSDTLLRVYLDIDLKGEAPVSYLQLVASSLSFDVTGLHCLLAELAYFYHGQPEPDEDEVIQFVDVANWLNDLHKSDEFAQEKAYWQGQAIPDSGNRLRLAANNGGDTRKMMPIAIGNDAVGRLCTLAQQQGYSVDEVLLAVWQALLAGYSDWSGLTVAVSVESRPEELEGFAGMLCTYLPLRVDYYGAPTLVQLLKDNHRQVAEHLEYREHFNWRDLENSCNNLSRYGFQCIHHADAQWGNNVASPVQSVSVSDYFDLQLCCDIRPGGTQFQLVYDCAALSEKTVAWMGGRFASLLNNCLDALAARSDSCLDELNSAPHSELQLIQASHSALNKAVGPTAHQQFAEHSKKTPDKIALQTELGLWTYEQINERADALAGYLQSLGLGYESRVAVCSDNDEHLIISMLAVMKVGGVYVPLDSQLQPQRIQYIIEDTGCRWVLTVSGKVKSVDQWAKAILVDELDTQGTIFVPNVVNPHQLAYLIYTSGSTGTPKGVGISHEALCHYVAGVESRLALGEDSGLLALASVATDLGHTALFGALLTGRTLHMLHEDKAMDVSALARHLKKHPVSCLKIVPSHLRALLTVSEPTRVLPTECLVLGGEALPVVLVEQVRTLKPGLRIINHYGPTEATVGILTYEVPSSADLVCPIGKPLAGADAFVIDRFGRQTGVGVVGELYLGGPALARGYWGRGDLTAERFVSDNVSGAESARLYCSGDLAYYREDGELVYVGRADYQVKVRGFRVELPEIESVLCSHPKVNEAAALLQTVRSENEAVGRTELVAHIVVADDGPEDEVICHFLEQTLPEYMMPVMFNRLKQLPLTRSGKVDRKALPFIDRQSDGDADYQPPQTEMEVTLVILWQELLGIEKVGIKDNFFAIGGDSIISIQLAARLNQLGYELTPKQLFVHSTIGQLAPQIEATEALQVDQGMVTGELALTPIQQRYFQLADGEDLSHYNQAVLFDIADSVSEAQLAEVLSALANHHDMLRVRYRQMNDGRFIQYLTDECSWSMQLVELSGTGVLDEQIEQANCSLDILSGRCVDARLMKAQDGLRKLLLCLHHLLVDGISWRLLIEDLNQALAKCLDDQPIEFSVKTTSFKDWADYQLVRAQTDEVKDQLDFWLEQQTVEAFPIEFSDGNNCTADVCSVQITLDAEATGLLLTDAHRAYKTQINELLLAAVSLACARWHDFGELVVELEGHGREYDNNRVNITRTLGWFTSRYPVKLSCNQADLADHIMAVKEQLRAVPERGVGYGLLRYLSEDDAIREQLEAAADGSLSFNYLGQFNDSRRTEALANPSAEEMRGVIGGRHPRSHQIQVNGLVLKNELVFKLHYSSAMYSEQSMSRLAACLSDSIEDIVSHCLNDENSALTPSDFPLANLSRDTLATLSERYNLKPDTVADLYPVTPLQHGMLFETQLNPGAGVNILQMDCTIAGPLSMDAWRNAWQLLVDRHSVFRTDFINWQGDTPLQRVHSEIDVPWIYEDWSDRSEKKQQYDYGVLLEQERTYQFDFSAVPLMRMVLVKLSDEVHKFIWNRHHSLMDGWSSARVLEEVMTAYEFIKADQPTRLPPVVDYRNYVQWLRERRAATDDGDYWRRYLKGFNQHTPITRQDSWLVGRNADKADSIEQQLPDSLSKQIQRFARQHHYTSGLLLQAAWGILLSRFSGQSDVVFGSVVSGRPPAVSGVESIVGPCINTVPTRMLVNLERTVHNLIEALQRSNTEREDYAYTPLNDIQQLSSLPAGEPLFASLFVVQNFVTDSQRKQLEKDRTRSTVELKIAPTSYKISYPLTCFMTMGEHYSARLYYDADCMDPAVVKAFGQGMVDILTLLVGENMQGIADYKLDCPSLGQLRYQAQSSVTDSTAKASKCKVHHIGIACQDIQQGIKFVEDTYEVTATSAVVYDPFQDAHLCMLETAHGIGIELVSGPQVQGLIQQSVILYHTCFEVTDFEAEIEVYRAQGCMLVLPPKPAILFDNRRVCFLQTPIGLVELLEAVEVDVRDAAPVAVKKVPVCVAATFTPELVEEPIDFWLHRLSMQAEVKVAPYGQLFQQLLDETSLIRHNHYGINVILIKLDDWFGTAKTEQSIIAAVESNVEEFILALTQVKQGKSAPVLVVLTPLAPHLLENPLLADWSAGQHQSITKRLAKIDDVHVLNHQQVTDWYPVVDYYDATTEKLAHIPYTEPYQHALGASVCRYYHAITRPPFKVIVLDCDNTLWGGEVGEVGPEGIVLDKGFLALQRKVVELIEQGMVLCLCSKNEATDVFEVFEKRNEMILTRDKVVAHRISWNAKSDGIKSMAEELNLGLDSFIFVDDDDVQCAEVAMHCPQVTVVQTPADSTDIAEWLNQVWAFDQLGGGSVTTGRTRLYRQNQEREVARDQFDSLQGFIGSLQMDIQVNDINDEDLPRVSELLLRTNQFNFTTRRHSRTDLTRWLADGSMLGMTVKVTDRFGDYGLVGVALYQITDGLLDVDSVLLSCRALGRGVEHHLLREIGARALAAGADTVQLSYDPTAKNTPARDFLNEVLGTQITAEDAPSRHQFSADVVASVEFKPKANTKQPKAGSCTEKAAPITAIGGDNKLFDTIARTLNSIDRIVASANGGSKERQVKRPEVYRTPENEVEQYLAKLWSDLLFVEDVGLDDHFFELGGHSLIATRVLSQVCNQYSVELPLATLFESPTLGAFAQAVIVARWAVDGGEEDDMYMEDGVI